MNIDVKARHEGTVDIACAAHVLDVFVADRSLYNSSGVCENMSTFSSVNTHHFHDKSLRDLCHVSS